MLRALLVLLSVVTVPASAAGADPTPSRSAIVISARPGLPDSNFDGSTILVTNSVADSPFGLVLNRPTQLTVAQLLPELADSAIAGEKVHFGGPVQIDSAWFLFRSQTPVEHAVNVLGDVYLSHDREWLRTLLHRGLTKECASSSVTPVGRRTSSKPKSRAATGRWRPPRPTQSSPPGTSTRGRLHRHRLRSGSDRAVRRAT
ncbi:MAG TPA: YqgE/AlgH family protein [Gemmatimonadaceae bacterium]